MNMYAYKLNLIDSYKPVEGIRGKFEFYGAQYV